jgi:hypothetical protein
VQKIFDSIQARMSATEHRQIEGLNMLDANSTTEKRPRRRRRRKETPQIETVGGELRVWRDQCTNEIIIESQVLAPGMLCGGLISLSARHARHLANSLLLFASDAESCPTVNAAAPAIQVAQDE